MNKSEVKAEADEFLREARELIVQGLVFLVPRDENRRWVNELGMVTEQVWAFWSVLLRTTITPARKKIGTEKRSFYEIWLHC